MGKNYNIPREHALTLKQLFEEDARTLPRVLAGCTFEWKPGTVDSMKSVFKTYKELIVSQVKSAAAVDGAEGQQSPPSKTPPPVPPRTGAAAPPASWQAGNKTPGAIPTKPGMMGGHRGVTPPPVPQKPAASGWQSATPSGAGGKTTIGAHRVPAGLVEKLQHIKDSASRTALVDAKALLGEGVAVGMKEATDAISDAIMDAVGIDMQAIFTDIAGDAVADVVFEITAAIPFVGAALGIAKNFSSSAASLFQAGMKQLSIRTVTKNGAYVTPGNPKEALKGVKRLLARKRDRALFRAATEAAHGAARGVALAGDVGAMGATGGAISSAVGIAGGLVKAAVNLAEAIIRALQDVKEMLVGNKLLLFPGQIKVSQLIDDCPLLCCYLITEASPSALIAFLSDGTLGSNWMDEVENLLPKIREIQRIANICERESMYKLKATHRYYGDSGGRLISSTFMSDRLRDIPAQVMHDLKHKLKKDPRALPGATKFWFDKITTMVRQGPGGTTV